MNPVEPTGLALGWNLETVGMVMVICAVMGIWKAVCEYMRKAHERSSLQAIVHQMKLITEALVKTDQRCRLAAWTLGTMSPEHPDYDMNQIIYTEICVEQLTIITKLLTYLEQIEDDCRRVGDPKIQEERVQISANVMRVSEPMPCPNVS